VVDGCNYTANILLLLTENMSIMTAHYYNPENPGIWTRAIPEFGIRNIRPIAIPTCNFTCVLTQAQD